GTAAGGRDLEDAGGALASLRVRPPAPRPAPLGTRPRDGPLPDRLGALADLRGDPDRQLRPRLLLHAGRLPHLYLRRAPAAGRRRVLRSEEHTSELQSPCNLVCRLLLEKKK